MPTKKDVLAEALANIQGKKNEDTEAAGGGQSAAAQASAEDPFVTPDVRKQSVQFEERGRQASGNSGQQLTYQTPVANRDTILGTSRHEGPDLDEVVLAYNRRKKEKAVLAAAKEAAEKCQGEKVAQQFMWQRNVGGEKDRMNKFLDEVLNTTGRLMPFAVTRKGSPVMKVVYGITKYYNGDVAPEYKGKFMGVVGERTERGEPFCVQLQEQATWQWKDVDVGTDIEEWRTYAKNEETRYQLWKPGEGGEKKRVHLPRALYLPPPLAAFLLEKDRTAIEAFEKIEEMVADESVPLTQDQAALAYMWFLAAGQLPPGDNNSQSIPLDVTPVMSQDEGFLEWLRRHVDSFVGQRAPVREQREAVPQSTGGQRSEALMEKMTDLLDSVTKQRATEAPAPAKKKEDEVDFDLYDMARLMGYCGTDDPEKVPDVWKDIKAAKKVKNVRNIIMEEIKKWADKRRVELPSGIFLSKQVIEDIKSINFAEANVVGQTTASGRGISNLVMLPRKQSEIVAMMAMEEAETLTEFNMTYEEAKKVKKVETRKPPTTFDEVKKNMGAYAGLIYVLLGEECPLYDGVWTIYCILKEEAVAASEAAYTTEKCKGLAWAVADDSFNYFSRELLPKHFDNLHLAIRPMTLLDKIFGSVRWAERIYRPTFPTAWMEFRGNDDRNNKRRGKDYEEYGGNGGGGGYDMGGDYSYDDRGPLTPTGGDFKHLHPKIFEVMKPINEKTDGRVSISRILFLGGKRMSDMPKWDKFPDDGVCWTWMCGKCKWGTKCKMVESHVDGKTMPEGIADEAVVLLKPGVEKMVNDPSLVTDGGRGFGGRGYGGRGFGGRGFGGRGRSGGGGRGGRGYMNQYKRQRQW